MRVKKLFLDKIKKIIFFKRSIERTKQANLFIKLNNIRHVKLTKEEKIKVTEIWGDFKLNRSFIWHQFYKGYHGFFNEYFIPDDIYSNYFERTLNYQKYSQLLQYKGILNIFIPEKNTPKVIVNNINNSFFTNKYKLIEHSEAVNKLLLFNRFLIKPSTDTGGGANVKFIDISKLDKERRVNYICDLFKK